MLSRSLCNLRFNNMLDVPAEGAIFAGNFVMCLMMSCIPLAEFSPLPPTPSPNALYQTLICLPLIL